MKYIKTYEKWKPKYSVGDYIIVTSEYIPCENEVMIIEDFSEVNYWCKFATNSFYDSVFEDEIIRKLSDHEVSALKYNL